MESLTLLERVGLFITALAFAVCGLYLLLAPKRIQAANLQHNENMRNWPLLGFFAHEVSRRKDFVLQLRMGGFIALLGAAVIVSYAC